jgi:Raf kinase inhibitor-like YbhB/YbcL family protein
VFHLESSDIAANSKISQRHVFNGSGCSGANISPALRWSGAPDGTRSFAVTVYDPDAPSGSGWWHWMVYDIPASVQEIATGAGNASGALPAGAKQGMTDYGVKAWGGPCPPAGDAPHRYVFTVFALSVDELDVSDNATSAQIGFNLNANKLATAQFTATFGR